MPATARVPLGLRREVPLRRAQADGAGSASSPVEAGRYATAINVHNPSPRPVVFRKKAVLLFDGSHPEDALERPMPPRRPVTRKLGPDFGLEIDCRDIREVLLRDVGGPRPAGADLHQGLGRDRDDHRHAARRRRRLHVPGASGAPETQAPSIAVDRVTGNRIRIA